MKNLKKSRLLLITGIVIVTVAIVWIAIVPHRNKTEAFLSRYEITDLTAKGFNYVAAINNKGQVLGYDRQGRTCIWDKTNGLKVINMPEVDGSPIAFNDSGHIAGNFQTPNGRWHAFIWDANTGLVDLGTLGGNESDVRAINNLGQAVGYDGQQYPFVWEPDTGMVDLSDITDNTSNSLRADDISNDGTVVGAVRVDPNFGYAAIAWNRDNGLVQLSTPQGLPSMARSISPSGLIAGDVWTSRKQSRLIVWDDPNNFRDLGSIGRNSYLIPYSINDAGQIIGIAHQTGLLYQRSFTFFFSDETGFIELGDIEIKPRHPKLHMLPWHLRSDPAYWGPTPAINNKGDVLTVTLDSDGRSHPILMTPKKKSDK